MPDISISVGIFCKCGEHLCNQAVGGKTPNRKLPFITVTPCSKCLLKAIEEGKGVGYETGYVKGEDEGYNRGHLEGVRR